jgi:hypothetical protein
VAPPSSTEARRVASSRTAGDPRHPSSWRAPLRVVPARRSDRARRRFVRFLPMAMVVVALLIVVAGQAMLASGQVRMARLDQQVQIARAEHRQQEVDLSKRETPARIGAAKGLVHPSHVTQVPSVSLHTPLPTPTVTPASQ